MSDAPNEGREEKNNGTTVDEQIKAINAEVVMYTSRMTWHKHQQALDDAIKSLEKYKVLRDQLSKERETAIDECKKIVHDFQATTIENMMAKLESLKYRI